MLVTIAVTALLYLGVRDTGLKALQRERQSFAVRVCKLELCRCEGHDANITTAQGKISGMQALKDMDSSTLKKVLGQVSVVCSCERKEWHPPCF